MDGEDRYGIIEALAQGGFKDEKTISEISKKLKKDMDVYERREVIKNFVSE